jgi:hypothetical protein
MSELEVKQTSKSDCADASVFGPEAGEREPSQWGLSTGSPS